MLLAVGDLYEELRMAIRRQSFPRYIYPLTWTFGTIVSGYNTHPEFNELYDFEVAVRQGSLNHGRRVLLSIMYLGAGEEPVEMRNWVDAYECLRNEDQGILIAKVE